MKKLIRDIKVGDTFWFPGDQGLPNIVPTPPQALKIEVTSVVPYGDSSHSLLVNDWVYDKMIEVELIK